MAHVLNVPKDPIEYGTNHPIHMSEKTPNAEKHSLKDVMMEESKNLKSVDMTFFF